MKLLPGPVHEQAFNNYFIAPKEENVRGYLKEHNLGAFTSAQGLPQQVRFEKNVKMGIFWADSVK